MTLGNTIAQYRKELGITQEALAQQLEVTNQAVSKWESDQCCPDILLLPKLADVFGITIDELFGREPKVQAAVEIHDLPWEDNEDVHAVLYVGRKMVEHHPAGEKVQLTINGAVCGDVHCSFNVSCGAVAGDVSADGDVNCGDVDGAVFAKGSVQCGDIEGDVNANGNITSGDISGDATAGGDVTCADVTGDVEAGGNVVCADVTGDVEAGKDIQCASICGNAEAGGKIVVEK